jgi:hypothetical protein
MMYYMPLPLEIAHPQGPEQHSSRVRSAEGAFMTYAVRNWPMLTSMNCFSGQVARAGAAQQQSMGCKRCAATNVLWKCVEVQHSCQDVGTGVTAAAAAAVGC